MTEESHDALGERDDGGQAAPPQRWDEVGVTVKPLPDKPRPPLPAEDRNVARKIAAEVGASSRRLDKIEKLLAQRPGFTPERARLIRDAAYAYALVNGGPTATATAPSAAPQTPQASSAAPRSPETPATPPAAPQTAQAPETPHAGIAAELAALASEVKPLAVTAAQVDGAQAFIGQRIGPADIDAANALLRQLNPKLRRLTLRDVAAFACVHRLSVQQQNGESPRERFTSVPKSARDEWGVGAWDAKHFLILMRVLIGAGFTKVEESHVPPSWDDGKRRKGIARRYNLNSQWEPAFNPPPPKGASDLPLPKGELSTATP